MAFTSILVVTGSGVRRANTLFDVRNLDKTFEAAIALRGFEYEHFQRFRVDDENLTWTLDTSETGRAALDSVRRLREVAPISVACHDCGGDMMQGAPGHWVCACGAESGSRR